MTATNGSDMAIRYLLETFGERGKSVVTVSPSFEMYWVNCSILGYNHVPVAYEKDFTIKIENILAAVNEETRIIVLLNPNNPIGNVYTEKELQKVIAKAKSVGAVVIIDEAYHYFYDKTFSKLFSIAACRLGVIIGTPEIINYVRNAKLTFDVNAVALLFGEKLLEHPDIIRNLIETEKKGKEYVLAELRNHGYECRDCRGNFIFVKPRHDAVSVAKELAGKKNVLVHAYNNEFLKDYIRVSVGSVKAMRIFLDAFFDIDK